MTKIRKCTTASSAPKSSGLADPQTKNRDTNIASTGKKGMYATTHQVAARVESSAGRPCHCRKPLNKAASGASSELIRSNLPVLASVSVEVNTSSESDVRKKRSAGKGDAVEIVAAEVEAIGKFLS